MKEHQLFLVIKLNTGDIQSNKDYISTFDASVDNVDVVTYNNLWENIFTSVVSTFENREQSSYRYLSFLTSYSLWWYTNHNMVRITIDTDEDIFLPFESFQRVCNIDRKYKYTRVMCIIWNIQTVYPVLLPCNHYSTTRQWFLYMPTTIITHNHT